MMRLLLSLAASCAALSIPPSPANSATPAGDRDAQIRQAVGRSLPLLDSSAIVFERQAHCPSCHNNGQTLAAETQASRKGIAVDRTAVERQLSIIRDEIEVRNDAMLLHGDQGGGHIALSGVMAGAVAGKLPASDTTDAAVVYLLGKQAKEGRWRSGPARGSYGSTDFLLTAQAVHTIDAYAPSGLRARANESVARARRWLETSKASNNESFVGRLEGLVWTRAARGEIGKASADLAAAQQSDGGWAQETGMASDAYATGNSLVALSIAGMKPSDPVYRRGVDYLLRTQAKDGSWYIKSRAFRLQPPIEGGFPYGPDQWISAWGTGLAAEALARALP